MSDALLALVGALSVAMITGGFSIFVNRPSKVATKAADIVLVAYEAQKQTILNQGAELTRAHDRIDVVVRDEADCQQRVDKLRAWVERLGGDVDKINNVGKQGPVGDKGATGDKGALG